MGKFCRKCGGTNQAVARFCEHCGAEFLSLVESKPALQPGLEKTAIEQRSLPSQVPSTQPKTVAIIAGAIVMVVIASGLAWYLIGSSALSNTEAQARIEEELGKRENVAELVCVNNLPYGRNEIRVGSGDAQTQQWMAMMVQAGIFETPVEANSGGLFSAPQLIYAKKEQANTVIVGNSLCFADGLEVASITEINESEKNNKTPKSVVRWQAKLKKPASWVKNELAQNAITNLVALTNGTYEMSTPFVFVEKRWQIDNGAGVSPSAPDPFASILGRPSKTQPKKPAAPVEFWSKLTSILSSSEAPGEVAKKFAVAANNGDVQTMLSLYPAKLAWIRDSPLVANLPQQSGLMGVTSVTVLSETISDDTAIVTLKLETAGGSIDSPMRLIKEDGKWKIDIEKM